MRSAAMLCLTIIITPVLVLGSTATQQGGMVWSTFLGGDSSEEGAGVAIDQANNIYVTGYTFQGSFPFTMGAFDISHNGWDDVFVTKLTSAGNALVYSTFLGGVNSDAGLSIAVDRHGDAYITGAANSADFPSTPTALDTSYNGGADGFVAKLNSDGSSLEFCTFLGGSSDEGGFGICVDDSGCVYVAGRTTSADFPSTEGAFRSTHNGGYSDAFVVKLDQTGDNLVYGTFLGGSSEDEATNLTIDQASSVFITGKTTSADFPATIASFDGEFNGGYRGDAYVAKLNPQGSDLEYATYLGGSGDDLGLSVSVDDAGLAYIVGETRSADFPTSSSAYSPDFQGDRDAFIIALNSSGADLVFGTYLGNSEDDIGHGVIVDASGSIYITGSTTSADFPTTQGAFDRTFNDGVHDFFISRLNQNGTVLEYSSFLGGSGDDYLPDIALAGRDTVVIVGSTTSTDFPTSPGAFDEDFSGGYNDICITEFIALSGPTAAEEKLPQSHPNRHSLLSNYPNPFNASTEIRYRLPQDAHVTLTVFNTLGQRIRSLVDADQIAEHYSVTWDGRDDAGKPVASGLYFCWLRAGIVSKTIKMALVR